MAKNDMCIARHTFAGDGPESTFADHHEWRFLRQAAMYNEVGTEIVRDFYYCIFCLRLVKRKGDGTAN